eukprot:TRINITY_DN45218_c0_g1_i1.p1 TRINITY_DN45218_c0_g1~~TRINITY_DN45218_c0_g1_i1.p1  ORF type:complete len:451 (+),score=82.64 TRINITY_DN45218_c0_g1_i1:40-1392(+)
MTGRKKKTPIAESSSEAEWRLEEICGTWDDELGSSYTLTLNEAGTALDVCTTRPSGETIETPGLILIDPRCPSNIVWGRGGPRAQYTLDSESYDTSTLTWKRYRSASFVWYRVEEVWPKQTEKPGRRRNRRSKQRSKPQWMPVKKEEEEEEGSEKDEEEATDELEIATQQNLESKNLMKLLDVNSQRKRPTHRGKMGSYQSADAKVEDGLVKSVASGDEDSCQGPEAGADAGKKLLAALCPENTDAVSAPDEPGLKDMTESLKQMCGIGDKKKDDNEEKTRAAVHSDPAVNCDATERLLLALRSDEKTPISALPQANSAFSYQWQQALSQNAILAASVCGYQQGHLQAFPMPCTVDTEHLARTLEHYFCDASLNQNSYLRNMVISDGWIPIMSLQTLPEMLQFGVDGWSMIQALGSSQVFELDGFACYVRLRDKARREQWAVPGTAVVMQ